MIKDKDIGRLQVRFCFHSPFLCE